MDIVKKFQARKNSNPVSMIIKKLLLILLLFFPIKIFIGEEVLTIECNLDKKKTIFFIDFNQKMVANQVGTKISKNFYYDDLVISWSYNDESIKMLNKELPTTSSAFKEIIGELISYDLKVSRVNGKILEKFTSEKRGIESFEWQCKKIQPTQKF